MQLAFYFDQTRCTGCYTCIIACKDWHDVPAGAASWRKVKTIEKGKYPDLSVTFLSTSCYHCADPACIGVCPVNAITKRFEDGVVVVDRESCLGNDSCGSCLEVCPYDAPQFGAEYNAKMQMCNFCYDDRLAIGKSPICVAACPMRALDFGLLEELRQKYGVIQNTDGFIYHSELSPSIIFKPKLSMISGVPRIYIAPIK